jgi:hypothetical protein
MTLGKCPMCLDTKPLIKSHLASAALYKLCRTPDSEPVMLTNEAIMQTSKQLQDHLLCSECDGLLSKNGENWLIPLLARMEGRFPFYEILTKVKPDIVEEDVALYAAARSPEMDVAKLTHFAMGMFWKASIHSWSAKRKEPLIDFGKYGEAVRRFLRSEAAFPEHMMLTVGVTPPPVEPTFNMPYRGRASTVHNFLFHVPGINFALSVGNQVNEEMRSACFASHPLHPILVKDLAAQNLSINRDVAAKAKKAAKLLTYVKESPHLMEYLKRRGKK